MTPRMDSRNAIFSPTNADFEAFPPTVKRKYFSTLERLRYAQGYPPASPMQQARPRTSNGAKHHFSKPSRFHRPGNRQVKDITAELPVREVTEAESAWYQSLPEKIKRNHFTFEERHVYAGKEESQVVDATEELFYRLGGRQANRSLPSLSSNSDHDGDDSTFDDVIDTPLDTYDAAFDHFKGLDANPPAEVVPDEYHNHIAPANEHRRPISSRDAAVKRQRPITNFSSPRLPPAIDRGKSCGDLRSARHQAASPSSMEAYPPRSSSISALSNVSSQPSSKPSLFERRASKRSGMLEVDAPPVPVIDPEATHISDPATRLKLKLYLGSAAKFDEAIEFGFPATATHTPPPSAMPFRRSSVSSYQSRRRSRSMSTPKPKPEPAVIGTTFFMDHDDEEDSLPSGIAIPMEPYDNGTVEGTGSDIHAFFAELPANNTPPPAPAAHHALNTPHTAPAQMSHLSIPEHRATRPPVRSQSISLRPSYQLALDTGVAQQHDIKPLMSARELPLKPWVEPTDSFGEREMTLRMTLTRKDLRADEGEIYPDGGVGSWDAQDRELNGRNGENRWRFWQRKR